MANLYKTYNGVAPTTAALVVVTTGTAIKTLLQIAPPSTAELRVVEWGISFDGSASAAGIKAELIETDVAATVTAHVAAGIVKMDDPGAIASNVTLGTATTGYTASAEGTTTASRLLDYQYVQPFDRYEKQWALGAWPKVQASKFLRVRVTAAAAVNAICWVVWAE